MRDVYPATHWAVRGHPPAFDTPDEEVYLVGRNLVLLAKAAVFCCQRRIPRIALGPLAGNPFPDATPAFFGAMGRAASLGLDHAIEIVAPYGTLHKADVVRRGLELGVPLDLTLSCMNPKEDLHCGQCSKCRERTMRSSKRAWRTRRDTRARSPAEHLPSCRGRNESPSRRVQYRRSTIEPSPARRVSR